MGWSPFRKTGLTYHMPSASVKRSATSLRATPIGDEGAGTTTIESKTNFFGPGVAGTTITAECLPLHRGRRTQTWQTSIRSPDGKLLAQVTQTQMVLTAGA